jgi:hypothetical protein
MIIAKPLVQKINHKQKENAQPFVAVQECDATNVEGITKVDYII